MSSTRRRCEAWGWSCRSASQQRMEPVGGTVPDLHQDSPQRLTRSLESLPLWFSSHSDTFLVWCQTFLGPQWKSSTRIIQSITPESVHTALAGEEEKRREEAAAAATFRSSQNVQTSGCPAVYLCQGHQRAEQPTCPVLPAASCSSS